MQQKNLTEVWNLKIYDISQYYPKHKLEFL